MMKICCQGTTLTQRSTSETLKLPPETTKYLAMSPLYIALVVFRMLTVTFPQTGYIHPDEFFQTVEVVAGDVFKLDVFRPWEFNASFPLRSMVLPQLLAGLPLQGLQGLGRLMHGTVSIVTPYTVLLAPRVLMALLSLIVDLSVVRLAQEVECCPHLAVLFHASSYATMVYLTRTLSNTTETILFSALIVIIIYIVRNLSNIKVLGMGSVSLGCILVSGFFNRPTFNLFAAFPMLVFLCKVLLGNQEPAESTRNARGMRLGIVAIGGGVGALLTTAVFVSVDTAYYNAHNVKQTVENTAACFMSFLPSSEMSIWSCIMSQVIVTPWNFISYNMDSQNLAHHGLHPRHLHFLVNIPILLGPLAVLCYVAIGQNSFIYLDAVKRKATSGLAPCRLRLVLLGVSFLIPLILLSFFPHQEPRFLLPLLPLAVVLAAKFVHASRWMKVLVPVWLTFSFLAVSFFGFLHQGAVLPAVMDAHSKLQEIRQLNKDLQVHLVFAKTYMPPRHLLLLPQRQNTTFVHDLGGMSVTHVVDYIVTLGVRTKAKCPRYRGHMWLYTPSSVAPHFMAQLRHKEVIIFCPHFSSEDPPRFHAWLSGKIDFSDLMLDFCLSAIDFG